jgi:secreted trypsin-like serine protease
MLTAYTKHEQYGVGAPTFNNDIATLSFATAITPNENVLWATLPADNSDQYVGATFTLSGWGRTSASNVLPNVLQKVNIPCISEADCNTRMAPVSGALTGPGQICFYDTAAAAGSCNGDSGGPANINGVVGGVTSWGIQGGGACLPSYPSVYSRTGYYLDWIAAN